jgi:superoxide dismutase, Fe-Mn family
MYILPKLNFEYSELEPFIDTKTVEIHYSKHHTTYLNKLNELLISYPELSCMSLELLLQNLDKVPAEIRVAVLNNGGQVYNHNLYWEMITPKNKVEFSNSQKFNDALDKFGSYGAFQKLWTEAGLTQFGSGWVWLCVNSEGELSIVKTGNAESPLTKNMDVKALMVMDVWEHAYYLNYQNKRADYVANFFEIINWKKVGQKYDELV